MTIKDRFLKYVSYDTQSREGADTVPSTEKQWALGKALEAELRSLGCDDVKLDEHCIVTGYLPANCENKNAPALGLIAHIDTAPDASGENVKPQLVENYDGGAIALGTSGLTLDPASFPALKRHVGETLVTTDGTTLLGADDKAGVAEIMQLVEYFRGLPCPNLGTGGGNYHGPFEFCSLTAMEKTVEVLVRLTALFAEQTKN